VGKRRAQTDCECECRNGKLRALPHKSPLVSRVLAYNPLRTDVRFRALVEKVGLPPAFGTLTTS
jgi:hypothetical protein